MHCDGCDTKYFCFNFQLIRKVLVLRVKSFTPSLIAGRFFIANHYEHDTNFMLKIYFSLDDISTTIRRSLNTFMQLSPCKMKALEHYLGFPGVKTSINECSLTRLYQVPTSPLMRSNMQTAVKLRQDRKSVV